MLYLSHLQKHRAFWSEPTKPSAHHQASLHEHLHRQPAHLVKAKRARGFSLGSGQNAQHPVWESRGHSEQLGCSGEGWFT